MLPALVRLSLSTISLLSASLARATGLSAVLVSPNHFVRNAVPSRVGVIIATEIFRRTSGTPERERVLKPVVRAAKPATQRVSRTKVQISAAARRSSGGESL
jgi:hypothetical protein